LSLLLGGGADDDCPHRHSLVKLILKQVQHQELTAEELERLKFWDDIWEFFEKQPATLETLQGIYAIYSNPDYRFIEFEADIIAKAPSPFNRLFADPLSLREAIAIAYRFVKSKVVGEPEAKTQIKGVAKEDKQSVTTFDVQLATQEIGKIGFKRKKITNFMHGAGMAHANGPVVSWSANRHYNERLAIYQTVRAAICDGAFSRKPFGIQISDRHFRYPVHPPCDRHDKHPGAQGENSPGGRHQTGVADSGAQQIPGDGHVQRHCASFGLLSRAHYRRV